MKTSEDLLDDVLHSSKLAAREGQWAAMGRRPGQCGAGKTATFFRLRDGEEASRWSAAVRAEVVS